MFIIESVKDMANFSENFRVNHPNEKIGFVPTMGYLHEGHISLIHKAKTICKHIVVSIFVNPIQFNDKKDYNLYPRNYDKDKELLKKNNVDVLFMPRKEEVYEKENPEIIIDYPALTKLLCGKNRPGHFQGVLHIVHNLFQWVKPHAAVFGLKDYQQFLLIEKMTRDLAFDINIIGAELIREKDGLALSSRNVRLSDKGRDKALLISKALFLTKDVWLNNKNTTAAELTAILNEKMKKLDVEYAGVYCLNSLDYLSFNEKVEKGLLAVAVKIDGVRLIDNLVLKD
ncbi:MAG: pantoate--beta-alanine ligase [Spirochaetia bacterium]|nr:pantoate--beta-alanine ligase [Spirochaetia bacterium]